MNEDDTRTEIVYDNWGLYVLMGVIVTILGIFVLSAYLFVSLASVLLFGWMLIFAGFAQIIQSFFSGKWSKFFLLLFSGLLTLVAGFLFVTNPGASILTLLLILALIFIAIGAYKMIASIVTRGAGWGWSFFAGLFTLLIGIIVWQSPAAGLTLIGLFIGLQLLITGISEIITGIQIHRQASARLAA